MTLLKANYGRKEGVATVAFFIVLALFAVIIYPTVTAYILTLFGVIALGVIYIILKRPPR
jgi:hypothetical protein